MTVGEWKEEILKNVCKKDAAKLAGAIETLFSWPTFKKEFQWTGMAALSCWLLQKAQLTETEFTKGVCNG